MGAICAIVVLAPEPAQPNPNPGKNAPPAHLIKAVDRRVPAAERRAINATLDRFIPAALDRRSMTTAWRLAGPQLRGGSSLRQWKAGTSPFPRYPAAGTTFHGWTTIDAGPNYVVFNLLVHPRRGSKTSSWVFSGEVIKRNSRWLVNRLYTVAVMQRPTKTGQHELGPADFAAGSAQAGAAPGNPALGEKWLLVIVGIVALAVLFPLAFGIGSVLRSRRRRLEYEESRTRSLPPLPDPAREPVGGRRS